MASLFPLADEALEMWLERNPDMARHRLTNAAYHQQFATMRVVLLGVEQALEAEGIARDVRRRVINTAVFGGPDPDAVMTADQIRRISEEQLAGVDLDRIRADLDGPLDPIPPCPHCPDGHQDPNRRPWAAWMSPKLIDNQPSEIVVARTDGAHVAESDAQWVRDVLNGRTCRMPVLPRRGDAVEAWLKQQRDEHGWNGTNDRTAFDLLDQLLDTYRLHADTRTPLHEHVCEAGNIHDCAGCHDAAVRDA